MDPKAVFNITWRFILLTMLFIIFYLLGSMAVFGYLPAIEPEPGLVSPEAGIVIIAAFNTLVIIAVIRTSNFSGWRLMLGLAVAYYGVATFMTQIETCFFLTGLTVGSELLLPLFLMGLPVALFFVPLAVLILGRGRAGDGLPLLPSGEAPFKEWAWRLAVIAVAYLIIYWLAGYYIAWQNPELRAFYGSPGAPLPFWAHTLATLQNDPGLFLFQLLRGVVWAAFVLPLVRGSKLSRWKTALLVGLFLSIPISASQIIANPLIPAASVRFSHLVETALSNFVFGVIVGLVLYRFSARPEKRPESGAEQT